MNFFDKVFIAPLGALIKVCYNLLGNYGMAIILFTLIIKVVLLPLSVWVHKNSIKMVKMQPGINWLKVKFFGDRERIADGQAELFKKNKYNPFASIIPLVVQVLLLMCVVQVIYKPLTYILDVPQELSNEMVNVTAGITNINTESSSVQLSVLNTLQNDDYHSEYIILQDKFIELDVEKEINKIEGFNMKFLGFDLSWVTVNVWGLSTLVPFLAGISSWLLCFLQNKVSVLQSEQGKLNKYSTTILSVGLSLYLGLLVPAGVALYWICSNTLAIIQMYALNAIIKPRKYVDYEDLEASRKALAEIQAIGGKKKLFSKDPNKKREKEDYKRFFKVANKHIVFYSEKSGFYKYYHGIIEYLLLHTNLKIHYVTNDPDDQIFKLAEAEPKIRPYYIGQNKAITLFLKMDAEIVVMTTPDLDNFYLKRSYVKKDIEYIYLFHGMGSSNIATNKGAYAHFDTIFCTGQHNINELREEEQIYDLPPRNLVPFGYGMLDDMLKDHDPSTDNSVKTILIAPSWTEDNILDNCIRDVLDSLLKGEYKIIVRPHPEYIKRYYAKLKKLMEDYSGIDENKLFFENDFSSNATIFKADILITDWSNISFEFSYCTKRPCLFVDTKMKVLNEDYIKYKNQPIDITYRNKIGLSIRPDEADHTLEKVDQLLSAADDYKVEITNIMEKSVFNLGESGRRGAEYIISRLKEKESGNKEEVHL